MKIISCRLFPCYSLGVRRPNLLICLFFVLFGQSAFASMPSCKDLFLGQEASLYRDTVNALRSKNFTHAMTLADRLILLYPGSAKAFALKAQAHMALKQYKEALPIIEQALQQALPRVGNQLLLLQMKATSLLALQQADLALPVINEILKTSPRNVLALQLQSQAFAQLENSEASSQSQIKVQSELKRNLYIITFDLLKKNKQKMAVPVLQQILRMDPKDSYAAGLLTNIYMNEGQFKEALSNLEIEIAINPENALAQGLKIRVLLLSNKAQEAYETALHLPPGDPYRSFYIASSLLEMGRWQEARNELEAVTIKTNDILWKLAQVNHLLGQYLQARQALIRIVQESDTIDYRAIATLLKINQQGSVTDASNVTLEEALLRRLDESQRRRLQQTRELLTKGGLWFFSPSIPRIAASQSYNNSFWEGIHRIPIDTQAVNTLRQRNTQ